MILSPTKLQKKIGVLQLKRVKKAFHWLASKSYYYTFVVKY